MIIGKSNETSWEEGGKKKKKERRKERFGCGNEGVGVKWIKCYGREIFESLLRGWSFHYRFFHYRFHFEIRKNVFESNYGCNEFIGGSKDFSC